MRKTRPIIVDYSKTVAEMIESGNYELGVNQDITDKHFPVKGSGKIELIPEIIHYGKRMSSDAVILDLNKRGLRPATLPELLAFGEKYPNEQRKYSIVALGSVWRPYPGLRHVASLAGELGRGLTLDHWGGDWCAYYRFLAFRK